MGRVKKENLDVEQVAERLRQEIPRLRRDYAVRSLGLFGSYVRGEQRRGSDLDVLVEFSEVPGMLRFLDLERDISQLVGIPVDLVQKEALKPAIGRRIEKEVLPI
ncbi:MAG: nucleotidyltransferase family protein [Geoalkalibacter sp.]|uniref:nucleotidyltransferase family protein n=1 Tax=Geoalkalibacter sp. TaxID=3041440 RepID=UPI003D11ED61